MKISCFACKNIFIANRYHFNLYGANRYHSHCYHTNVTIFEFCKAYNFLVQVACKNNKSVIILILTKMKYMDNNLFLLFYIYLQIITFMLNFACKYNKIVILPTFMHTDIIHNLHDANCYHSRWYNLQNCKL